MRTWSLIFIPVLLNWASSGHSLGRTTRDLNQETASATAVMDTEHSTACDGWLPFCIFREVKQVGAELVEAGKKTVEDFERIIAGIRAPISSKIPKSMSEMELTTYTKESTKPSKIKTSTWNVKPTKTDTEASTDPAKVQAATTSVKPGITDTKTPGELSEIGTTTPNAIEESIAMRKEETATALGGNSETPTSTIADTNQTTQRALTTKYKISVAEQAVGGKGQNTENGSGTTFGSWLTMISIVSTTTIFLVFVA